MQVDKTDTDKVLSSSRSATERVGYIVISKASAEDIERDREVIDGIAESSKFKVQSSKSYDLTGRRTSTLSRGVYIIDGKKVVVK